MLQPRAYLLLNSSRSASSVYMANFYSKSYTNSDIQKKEFFAKLKAYSEIWVLIQRFSRFEILLGIH